MEIAKFIDHTNLKPNATEQDIRQLCAEAKQYGFAAVCVTPCNVPLASKFLKDSGVKVCAVCGFPLGANTTETKTFEAAKACTDGAEEIDMVINIGKLKDADVEYVLNDIKAVKRVLHGIVLKVILETSLLTREEKILACKIIKEAGADFAKTSTGFSIAGATVEDVVLMREILGKNFGIKAAGGIHDRAFAEKLINAGATRIGSSKSIEICRK